MEPPPAMTAAEFKAMREGLGLSAKATADLLGIKNERTIRHWEACPTVPLGAARQLQECDELVWMMAHHGLETFREHPAETIAVLRYETEEDFLRYHPGDKRPLMHRLHAAAINRLRVLLRQEGIHGLRIVSMMPWDYEKWREGQGQADSEQTRSAWAAVRLAEFLAREEEGA